MTSIDILGRSIRDWLRESDPVALAPLFDHADATRRETVGDAVHLRGLIEVSNICVRSCGYCGIRTENTAITRYRMDHDAILDCARRAASLGYGTVVLQGGEDPGLDVVTVADIIRDIKAETSLAITLSLGERSDHELQTWRDAGADRYLLRFETSDPVLFARIHPSHPDHQPRPVGYETPRIGALRRLAAHGYQVGSGVMVGIPGQTWATLERDLAVFRKLNLDMIGIGPWIPHPATPLAVDLDAAADPAEQVPNTVAVALRMIALARITVPDANIPATTAIATLDKDSGREDALRAGANVVMPNLTPAGFRELYEIYPDKACMHETAEQCHACLTGRIARIGRTIGTGPGATPRHR